MPDQFCAGSGSADGLAALGETAVTGIGLLLAGRMGLAEIEH
jgi:hypothetical protein